MSVKEPRQELKRYRRQMILPQMGKGGQEKLRRASVLLVGAGATGSMLAEILVRAGVGGITIVDRDFVELHNLHRQFGYTEKDVGQPKAECLARRLESVNSEVRVSYRVGELDHRNVTRQLENSKVDIVMDATDNIYSRQVLNEACFREGIPWVYCGATGTTAMAAAFPFDKIGADDSVRDGSCFRCLIPVLPPPGAIPTCETAGILNTAAAAAASMAATEGMKLIVGIDGTNANNNAPSGTGLMVYDIWAADFQRIEIPKRDDCLCCVRRDFEFLEGKYAPKSTSLCGEGTYQINFTEKMRPEDFERLRERLSGSDGPGLTASSEWHFSFMEEDVELTIFRDGRMMVKGVESPEHARALYDRYVGL